MLSDWGLQQFPGVFVDDIEVSTGEGTTSFEDDGDPMDGWTVPGAPQDEAGIEGPNRNDWVRRGGLGIKEGAAIGTPDTRLPGLRLRGHHRRRDAQRGHGPGGRLPAALNVRARWAGRASRPPSCSAPVRPAPTMWPAVRWASDMLVTIRFMPGAAGRRSRRRSHALGVVELTGSRLPRNSCRPSHTSLAERGQRRDVASIVSALSHRQILRRATAPYLCSSPSSSRGSGGVPPVRRTGLSFSGSSSI